MVQLSGWIIKIHQQLQETECLVSDNPFFLLDKWKSLYLSFHKHCPYNWRARFKFKLIRLCFPKLRDNGPLGKLSHGSPSALMGTSLIRNRAGLVMSPSSQTDTHSDPSRAWSAFCSLSLLCIFPALLHLCDGAGVIISAQVKPAEAEKQVDWSAWYHNRHDKVFLKCLSWFKSLEYKTD